MDIYDLEDGDRSWMYTYSQIYQAVYAKYVQLFTYQSYVNEVV